MRFGEHVHTVLLLLEAVFTNPGGHSIMVMLSSTFIIRDPTVCISARVMSLVPGFPAMFM